MEKSYWKDKKVIVAGGSGFLGSHFIEELLGLGAYIICVDRSVEKKKFPLENLSKRRLLLKKINLVNYSEVIDGIGKADMIINCAALDGNADFKINHAAEILDTNMRITSNILNVAKVKKIKNVVLISSAEIYSPQAESPITEEDDYRKYNDYIGNGYVLSKTYSEILGSFYEGQYGINVFLPRPTNMYGPGDHFSDRIGRVIPRMIKKALNGDPIEIWGDGSQVRQFIHVKDAVRSILIMVETNKFHRLNIASGEPIKILKLAKLIMTAAGKNGKIILDARKPTGVKFRTLNVSKLDSILNFKFRSLEEGVKEMIEWYIKNKGANDEGDEN